MIDYHTHLLPGIDDGAASLEESVAIARILAAVGFTEAHCTPHFIKGGYETAPARVREMTARLQEEYAAAGISLRLVPGTEHYLDEYLRECLPDVQRVGESRHILVEAPFRCAPDVVTVHAGHLLQSGLIPLFAHPERCSVFAPARKAGEGLARFFRKKSVPVLEGTAVAELKGRGCRFQGNLGSFAGVYGAEVKERALWLLQEGLYSCLGSDAHRADRLEAVLLRGIAVVEEAVGKESARRLLAGSLMV